MSVIAKVRPAAVYTNHIVSAVQLPSAINTSILILSIATTILKFAQLLPDAAAEHLLHISLEAGTTSVHSIGSNAAITMYPGVIEILCRNYFQLPLG